jgi:hypothetical protein
MVAAWISSTGIFIQCANFLRRLLYFTVPSLQTSPWYRVVLRSSAKPKEWFMKMFFLICTVGVIVCSCGSGLSLLSSQHISEASVLREVCAAQKLTGTDVRAADSLLDLAQKAGGKKRIMLSDFAAARYRCALARNENEKSDKLYVKTESALQKVKEQVAVYNRVLEELRSQKGP